MNWANRKESINRAEAIFALTNGIATKVTHSELQEFAKEWNIPLVMQQPPTASKTASNDSSIFCSLPEDEEDQDEEDEEDYESSQEYDEDYYESSSDC